MGKEYNKTTPEEKEERFEKIIDLIGVSGYSLKKALSEVSLYSNAFADMLNKCDKKKDRYVRACHDRADNIFEEILEIADDDNLDVAGFNDDGIPIVDGQHIQRAKLRIDSRKWMLGKLRPKKYGDKLEVTGQQTNVNLNAEFTQEEIKALNEELNRDY